MRRRLTAIPDEYQLAAIFEKLWLALDVVAGLIWSVVSATAAALFLLQGCASVRMVGSPPFFTMCFVIAAVAAVVTCLSVSILLTSTGLLLNRFDFAGAVLAAKRSLLPLKVLKLPADLSIAYCLDASGKTERADQLYEALKPKRAVIRHLSPLFWGVAFDAFAEWLDKQGLLKDDEPWLPAWERCQIVRHVCAVAMFLIPGLLIPNLVAMVPAIAGDFGRAGDYQLSAALLSGFVASAQFLGPENAHAEAVQPELADSLTRAGDYKGAEAVLRAMIAKDNAAGVAPADNRDTVRRLAMLLELDGRGKDAENLYIDVMKTGGNVSVHELLPFAQFYFRNAEYDKSEKILTKALALPQLTALEESRVHFNLGEIYYRRHDLDQAKSQFQKALAIAATLPEDQRSQAAGYKLALAKTIYSLGKHEQALEMIKSLTAQLDAMTPRQQSSEIDIYETIATTYEEIGETAQAIHYMELAVKLASNIEGESAQICGYLVQLSEMYMRNSQFEKAKRILDQALAIIEKHNQIGFEGMVVSRCFIDEGTIALSSGNFAGAQASFSKAIELLRKSGTERLPQSSLERLAKYRQYLSSQHLDAQGTELDKLIQHKAEGL